MEVSVNIARDPKMGPSHTHTKCLENQVELSSGISKLETQWKSEGNDSIFVSELHIHKQPFKCWESL